jgi:hypothetical protein
VQGVERGGGRLSKELPMAYEKGRIAHSADFGEKRCVFQGSMGTKLHHGDQLDFWSLTIPSPLLFWENYGGG